MKFLRFLLAGVLLASLAAALGVSQHDIFNRRIQYRSEDRIFLLPRKEILKRLAMGNEKAVADLLWIRAVQFFGGNYTTLIKEGMEYKGEGIRKLFYIIQYLDPDFYQVYEFGAFVFNEGLRDHEEAIRMLDLGSRRFENDFRLLFDAAFVCFYYMDDKERALEFADRASERPGAPEHVRRFKGQLLSRLGSYDAAADHFQRLMEESQSDLQREVARANLMRVLREKDLYQLDLAMQAYREKTGRDIRQVEDLVAEGILDRLPLDPEDGGPYYYVSNSGELVSLNQALDRQRQYLQVLQRTYDQYYQEHGIYPERLEDLVGAELLERDLRDPLGGRYAIDPAARQIYVIPQDFE